MSRKDCNRASQGRRQERMRLSQSAANLHHEAEAQQRAAEFAQRYRRWILRRAFGYGLAALGAIVLLVHVGMHLGNVTLFAMQDLAIGYPTGGLLILSGILVGSRT